MSHPILTLAMKRHAPQVPVPTNSIPGESDDSSDLAKIAGEAKVVRYLTGCPQSGQGVHSWIFSAALMCADLTDWSGGEIIDRLMLATQECGRFVPRSEIARQVRSSLFKIRGEVLSGTAGARAESKPRETRSMRQNKRACVVKWPNPDPELIADKVAASPVKTVADLRALSHSPAAGLSAEAMVDALFPGNPWLCVGMANWDFGARRKQSLIRWGQLDKLQLIVPSAMSRRIGPTEEGTLSEHAKSSVGPRQYLVVEADDGTKGTQAAVLWHLGQFLPLACVVSSRGKSLHGWFRCVGEPESELCEFYRYARLLGADTAAWNINQFVRLPGGTRRGKRGHPGNGKRQTVIYFNPQNTIQ